MSNYVLDETGVPILAEVDIDGTTFILEENQGLGLTATLTWNANTEPDLAGYNVYHGEVSGTYYESVFVSAPQTMYTWTDLYNWAPHFFVITAVNTSGAESAPSAEVEKVIFFKKYSHLGMGASTAV